MCKVLLCNVKTVIYQKDDDDNEESKTSGRTADEYESL